MTRFHPFLEEFIAEHNQALSELKALKIEKRWKGFFAFAQKFILDSHEKREELFLFAPLSLKPGVRSGGPECVRFFGARLENPPLMAVATLCGTPVRDPHQNLSELRKPFFQTSSPVCIPIEDHMALEEIVKSAAQNSEEPLQPLVELFFSILTGHIAKEETCLFRMAQTLLSKEELDACYEKSLAWKPNHVPSAS